MVNCEKENKTVNTNKMNRVKELMIRREERQQKSYIGTITTGKLLN